MNRMLLAAVAACLAATPAWAQQTTPAATAAPSATAKPSDTAKPSATATPSPTASATAAAAATKPAATSTLAPSVAQPMPTASKPAASPPAVATATTPPAATTPAPTVAATMPAATTPVAAPSPSATKPVAAATTPNTPPPAVVGEPQLSDLNSKVSYIVGLNLGRQLKNDKIELNFDVFLIGMKDAQAEVNPKLSREEMQSAYEEFLQKLEATEANAAPAAAAADTSPTSNDPVRKDLTSKVSYVIGLNLAKRLKQDRVDVGLDHFMLGIKDAYADEVKPRLTNEQVQAVYDEYVKTRTEKEAKANTDYLAENAKKEGVKVLPSGLQYKVLRAASAGSSPKPTDSVTVNYEGRLVDGTVFDSSFERGQPATFGVTEVIKGWTEILQLMKPGDSWEVTIPGELAYGERGSGDKIGPNATLVFKIDLIAVEAAEGGNP